MSSKSNSMIRKEERGGSHSKFGGAPPASRFEKKREHAVPDHDSGNDEILAATEEAAGKANLCNGCGRAHAGNCRWKRHPDGNKQSKP